MQIGTKKEALKNDTFGIWVDTNSKGNRIYHNSIINNRVSSSAGNIWDGNYWSDYRSIDANNDGTGDTPYIINSKAKDNYPLMAPYKEPTPLLTPTSTPSGGWIQNPANGHYYKLTTSLQWLQAEAQAVNWGGHLVTINDRQEELWLRNQFGSNELFWMGFNDVNVEGRWGWVSFEPVNYTNWWAGEPNDMSGEGKSEDAAVMNWGGFEKINGTGITYYGDGWNDIPIEIYTRGIVEISTSTPLPTPTPTPMKGTIIVTSTGGVIRSISPSIIGTIITVLAIFLIFLSVVYSNRIKDEKLIIQRIDELIVILKTKKLDNNELRDKLIEINKDLSHKESYDTSYKGYFFAVALVLVVLALGYLMLAPEATEAPINMKSISTPAPTIKATPNITHTLTVTPTKTTTATPVRLKVVEDVFNGDASAANKAGLERFENGYYYVVDWQGEKYVALKGKTTKLVKLIQEQGNDTAEKKSLTEGDTWDVGGGWTVMAISIDAKASPGQVWLVLSKDGIKKDDKVVRQGEVYTYIEKSIGGESDVPLFVTYIARVYAGATSDRVQLSYTWAVDTTTIQTPKVTPTVSPTLTPAITEIPTPEPVVVATPTGKIVYQRIWDPEERRRSVDISIYAGDAILWDNFDGYRYYTIVEMNRKLPNMTLRPYGKLTYVFNTTGNYRFGLYYPYMETAPSIQNITVVSPAPMITSIADQKTYTSSIGMEFVQIPAGEFNMGSPYYYEAGRDNDEDPMHLVKIFLVSLFLLCLTPIYLG